VHIVREALRFTTWLAPGLPEGLFAAIASHVATGLGYDHILTVEPTTSGPIRAEDDVFAAGLTHIGFVCPPSYLWLSGTEVGSVVLIPRAPVHDDPRAQGRPVYFSDLVVRSGAPIRTFADLGGKRVGFNDRSSLSGYLSILSRLAADGLDPGFFGEFRHAGSHREALDRIADGELDAAAIDGNVWRAWSREHPDRRGELRSIAPLGPFPVQPLVVRADAAPQLLAPIAALLDEPTLRDSLRPFGIKGFAPVTSADYEALRPALDLAATLQ